MNFTYFGIHTTIADADADDDNDDDADDVAVHDELVVVAAGNRVGGESPSATVVTHTQTDRQARSHTDTRADGGYRKSVHQLWREESARERKQESKSSESAAAAATAAAPGTCQIRDGPSIRRVFHYSCVLTHVYMLTRVCVSVCMHVLMCIVQFGLHELQRHKQEQQQQLALKSISRLANTLQSTHTHICICVYNRIINYL